MATDVIEKTRYLKKDSNRAPIPVGRNFTTDKYTIAANDTLEAIEVPDGAVEVLMSSVSTFKYAAASDGEPITPPGSRAVILPVIDMDNIYVQGLTSQSISLTWVNL